jgi:hypothetical protein
MGNVLSIMQSYRLYKENKDRALYSKKRKYCDFLKECKEVLNKNQNIDENKNHKLGKIE